MIESIPTWSFEPNWSGTYTEALEWLTDVLASPVGAEQRRSLREFPRRTIEYSSLVAGNDREFLRQFLEVHGGRTFYLPLWHEAYRSTSKVLSGASFIPCQSSDDGGIRVGDVLFIGGEKSRKFELAEVESMGPTGISLVAPVGSAWAAGSKLHPVRKARLVDQPTFRRSTDSVINITATFRIMEQNNEVFVTPSSFFTSYGGFNTVKNSPDYSETMDFTYSRLISELDNSIAFPRYYDVGGMTFPTQAHTWLINGRAEYDAFKSALYTLKGRFTPVWVPSFSSDMTVVVDTPIGDSYITIENIGFTESGTITDANQNIVIEYSDGTRDYRKIISSATSGEDNEIIGLDQPFTTGLSTSKVIRISFMRMSRLDQDRVEIIHVTDTKGYAKSSTVFKTAPNIRIVKSGF